MMTIAMTPMSRQSSGTVHWRALESGLWVARRDGRHIGSVQQGRRWVGSDAEGEPIGVFRTLREAQDAVADPASGRAPIRSGSGAGWMLATGALGLVAVVSAAEWVLAASMH